jgi:hypothetical protein
MSQTRASDVLNWIVHAEDVPADHLDVGRLQVLAGAHGVAEAPVTLVQGATSNRRSFLRHSCLAQASNDTLALQ